MELQSLLRLSTFLARTVGSTVSDRVSSYPLRPHPFQELQSLPPLSVLLASTAGSTISPFDAAISPFDAATHSVHRYCPRQSYAFHLCSVLGELLCMGVLKLPIDSLQLVECMER